MAGFGQGEKRLTNQSLEERDEALQGQCEKGNRKGIFQGQCKGMLESSEYIHAPCPSAEYSLSVQTHSDNMCHFTCCRYGSHGNQFLCWSQYSQHSSLSGHALVHKMHCTNYPDWRHEHQHNQHYVRRSHVQLFFSTCLCSAALCCCSDIQIPAWKVSWLCMSNHILYFHHIFSPR